MSDASKEILGKVTAAIARHRTAYGGPASAALADSSVMTVIVAALDEERDARDAAIKAERKRVAAATEGALSRWRDLLAELDGLDAPTVLSVSSRIAADVETRSRAAIASDDDWRLAMTVASRAWWSSLRARPSAAVSLVADQLRRAVRALGEDDHA